MDEVKSAKESLKLVEKGSAQSRTLSGGMKRKLSVGIALCAGSKVPHSRVLGDIFVVREKQKLPSQTSWCIKLNDCPLGY